MAGCNELEMRAGLDYANLVNVVSEYNSGFPTFSFAEIENKSQKWPPFSLLEVNSRCCHDVTMGFIHGVDINFDTFKYLTNCLINNSRMAEWLALPTAKRGAPGSIPNGIFIFLYFYQEI